MSDNFRSRAVTEGLERAPNRAMLRAVGFQDADFVKPIVGVASACRAQRPAAASLGSVVTRICRNDAPMTSSAEPAV